MVTDPRGRPRRRGHVLEQAIREATVEELADIGYPALTVERVAQRARTSKAVIYRRWPGLAELVVDSCAHHQMADVEVPDTGRYRTDVLALLCDVLARVTGPSGGVIRTVISEIARDPEFAALAEQQLDVVDGIMRTLLERGIRRGEVDPGAKESLRATVATDLLYKHVLMSPTPPTEDLIVRIVDDIHLPLVQRRDANPSRVSSGDSQGRGS